MNILSKKWSPSKYALFGVFVFPVLHLFFAMFVHGLVVGMGWVKFRNNDWPEFGTGGVLLCLAGVPLGIFTALIVSLHEENQVLVARILAALFGVVACGFLVVFAVSYQFCRILLFDAGWIAPPFLWAALLVFYAFEGGILAPKTPTEIL